MISRFTAIALVLVALGGCKHRNAQPETLPAARFGAPIATPDNDPSIALEVRQQFIESTDGINAAHRAVSAITLG